MFLLKAKDVYNSDVRMSPWSLVELFRSNIKRGDLVINKTRLSCETLPVNSTLKEYVGQRTEKNLNWYQRDSLQERSTCLVISIDSIVTRGLVRTTSEKFHSVTDMREFPVSDMHIYTFLHLFVDNKDVIVKTEEVLSIIFAT